MVLLRTSRIAQRNQQWANIHAHCSINKLQSTWPNGLSQTPLLSPWSPTVLSGSNGSQDWWNRLECPCGVGTPSTESVWKASHQLQCLNMLTRSPLPNSKKYCDRIKSLGRVPRFLCYDRRTDCKAKGHWIGWASRDFTNEFDMSIIPY